MKAQYHFLIAIGSIIVLFVIYKFVGALSAVILIAIGAAALYFYALQEKTEKEKSVKKLGEMVQLDRMKNDFLSVAQHQLRTPLSGVKWALEMLKNEGTLPKDSLALIDAGLERIKDSIEIINQMLKTVEVDNAKLVLSIEGVDLVGMIRTIIAELNFMSIKKGVKLNFIYPEALLINADRSKLKAALINIIDNAIKYSPKGKVEITLTDNPDNATIIVKDTGIGIAPQDLPYVFERLHRGKNAVSIEPDESGVGLYTSKKMIDLHGGAISVESELDKGTAVTVVLPKNL